MWGMLIQRTYHRSVIRWLKDLNAHSANPIGYGKLVHPMIRMGNTNGILVEIAISLQSSP